MLYLVTESDYSAWTLVGVATLGNVLGGCTNYALGLLAARGFRVAYFEKEHRREALDRIQRYGAWALLFSWLPIVGDPLCLAAGYLRTNLWLSILCMTLGKLFGMRRWWPLSQEYSNRLQELAGPRDVKRPSGDCIDMGCR